MTAKEMKIKAFSLIEEYYPDKKLLADDQDVIYKANGVINSVMLDLIKYKKLPAKYTYNLKKSSPTLALDNIPDFYQLNAISDIDYEIVGDYEIKFNVENMTEDTKKISIYYYKYPELMDLTFEATNGKTEEEVASEYDNSFEFDLPTDILEIMPYGIAADLLKQDMISNYGKYFYERYQELKQMLDRRRTNSSVVISGGLDF